MYITIDLFLFYYYYSVLSIVTIEYKTFKKMTSLILLLHNADEICKHIFAFMLHINDHFDIFYSTNGYKYDFYT